jgi:hypothetical protein
MGTSKNSDLLRASEVVSACTWSKSKGLDGLDFKQATITSLPRERARASAEKYQLLEVS